VDQLLKRDGGLLVVLTSRDEERGKVALGELAAVHGQERLLYRQLDIDQPESVNSAAEWVKKEYGGIDLLINNAGIAWKGDAFTDEVRCVLFANGTDQQLASGRVVHHLVQLLWHAQYVPGVPPAPARQRPHRQCLFDCGQDRPL